SARVVAAHFSVMVRGTSQLFVAGPPLVEHGMRQKVTKEELGGWEIHTRGSGAVDNAADSEEEALQQCRRFLSYLPPNVWHLPPRSADPVNVPDGADELRSIVPRSRRQVYEARRILELVFDTGSI